MLAKNHNDNAYSLRERGACEFFASKLAPTRGSEPGVGLVHEDRNQDDHWNRHAEEPQQ